MITQILMPMYGQESQSIRLEINQVVDSIASENIYKSARVGYSDVKTSQWERFLNLKEKAKNNELRQLTNHINPVVRCYSFQALAERQDSMTFQILLNHLKDNEYVLKFKGCMVSGSTVGDFFVDTVTPDYVSLSAYKLTESEQKTLDSLLIFDPKITLSAKSRLMKDLQPKPQYLESIRQIVKEENIPQAVIALARFQEESDVELIKEFFQRKKTESYAIYAACEFPHKAFYPELVNIFNREWEEKYYDYAKWRILYQSLAKYDNEQTLDFFEQTVNEKNNFRRKTLVRYLLIAITKYPSENFEGLKSKIALEDYDIDAIQEEIKIEK